MAPRSGGAPPSLADVVDLHVAHALELLPAAMAPELRGLLRDLLALALMTHPCASPFRRRALDVSRR